ncbi:L,D-transpeptidase family protein [Paradevosia shaoguanensis]|uniref:L,D-transpeptidase family protein n=1 Tax=Paradevosia shaoguanensis TaxID=1335043 RepID=UPI00068D006D|nr:L,D-transpeptidase family protein [Paradevosia shaoguanensis]
MIAKRFPVKSLTACALLALTLAYPAIAQETVNVDGMEATRVVIAPPQNELARSIKTGLATAYYGAKDTPAYNAAQKLYYFYGERAFEPLWLTQDASGKLAFSPVADKLVAIFKQAEYEGLRASDYLTPALDVTSAQGDPARMAGLETAFSQAVMLYAQNLYGGRIDPRKVSANIDIKPRLLNQPDLLPRLAASDDPAKILAELDPTHREFLALKTALAKFYDGSAAQEQVTIPDGQTLRVGMVDERVPLLRQRLEVPASEDGTEAVYDKALAEAVTNFQDSLGLLADGIAGPATIAALNGGSATSKEDIIANMERWRWMPEDLGQFNVFVNIPEFRLAVMKGDDVTYTTRVVVGKAATQTPIFSDNIRHIVVNPYWNVPPSIASNEIRPALMRNPGYLDAQNMELLYGGKVVNAAMVDWSTTSMSNFRVRQRPGAGNSLGNVKFLFPNSHDVYLHDTPSKSLFGRSFRAYSHGCVRVQNPMEFADALLVNEPSGLNSGKLEAMYGPSERWVNLETRVPVHLAYFTLRVDQDGTIRSYGDVYGHNKKLIELLGG